MPKPGYHWPVNPSTGETLSSIIVAFGTEGYQVCDDSSFEKGFEKIAVYVDDDGDWTHTARQLTETMQWTSKLGDGVDVRHSTLEGISGELYGYPRRFMKRAVGLPGDKRGSISSVRKVLRSILTYLVRRRRP
jgi:hypothetical protein